MSIPRRASSAVVAIAILIAGCDRAAPAPSGVAAPSDIAVSSTAPATRDAATTQVASALPRIVFLGDSLTAGLGVEADQAFPAIVGEQLRAAGVDATIVNAGVSGDTTAGGLRRLDWLLRQRPAIVVVGLGGNDGLRGLDVDASASNLRQIVERARASGADVLLLGMLIPTNYGPEYRARFAAIYPAIAKELDVPLVPFLLEGVGGSTDLNQPDGIHPTAMGHAIVASNVVGPLRALLRARHDRRPGG